jgi:hypothetical protein
MTHFEWRDGVVVFLLRISYPISDGGQSLVGVTFIANGGVRRKAIRQRFKIAGVLDPYIKIDWGLEMDGHRSSFGS